MLYMQYVPTCNVGLFCYSKTIFTRCPSWHRRRLIWSMWHSNPGFL